MHFRLTKFVKTAAVAAVVVLPIAVRPIMAQTPTAIRASNRAALLAADRAFAKASESTDLVSAITGMMADSVTAVALGELFHGVPAVREALNRNADNARSTMTWTPIQGDVSNDGQTGYTLGFATWKKPDGVSVPGKYVSYWIKQRGAWRVLVYKRVGRAAGDVTITEEAAPPKALEKPAKFSVADSMKFSKQLDATERQFSVDAGIVGLGKAFENISASHAHQTGAATDPDFLRGPAAIGAGLGAGEPPLGTITWAPTVANVARSGDLGITFGYITLAAAAGTPARRVSYLTVWTRDRVTDPWRMTIE